MKNGKEKLSNDRCSLVSGGNASGTHYIYQCPNCGKGAITAYDGEWNCDCGMSSRKVDEVYLDLDSKEGYYGVPEELLRKYNVLD